MFGFAKRDKRWRHGSAGELPESGTLAELPLIDPDPFVMLEVPCLASR